MAGDSVIEREARVGEPLTPAVSWGAGSEPSVPSVDNEDRFVR
jgi:hypothetical protein